MKFIKHRTSITAANEAEMLAEYRRTGDLEILGSLYENYMSLLYGLCLKYYKDEEQSKDAVMQIFEQLISKLKVHEVSNFKSWLYTLARNHCLMDLRAAGKHQFVDIDSHDMESPSFYHHQTDDMLKEGQLNSMERCMKTLADEQRISVDLFYLQQKCYKEISHLTGFDVNKVKSYIQNGKRNLKICMEKKSGNE